MRHLLVRCPVRIAIDFDGVIHDCPGFKAPRVIDGEPIHGAFDWIRARLDAGDTVTLHTCRLMNNVPHNETSVKEEPIQPRIEAIASWFYDHGGCDIVRHPRFMWWVHGGKPWADIYIDDKAARFDGTFPDLEGSYEL